VVDGGEIGRQDDVNALTLRAAAALEGVPDDRVIAAGGAAPPSDVQACADLGAPKAEPVGGLRYRAVGTFRGTAAVFFVFDRSSPPPRLLVIRARTGCAVLASIPF